MKACGLLICVVFAVAVACSAAAPDVDPTATAAVPPEVGQQLRVESLKIPTGLRGCNNGTCNMWCVLYGYIFGACSGGECYCYYW